MGFCFLLLLSVFAFCFCFFHLRKVGVGLSEKWDWNGAAMCNKWLRSSNGEDIRAFCMFHRALKVVEPPHLSLDPAIVLPF